MLSAHSRTTVTVWSAIAVMALVIVFYKLGSFRTFGSHEVFAAEPARNMLRTGNYVTPEFGGLPRLKKPPLCYWVIAASGAVFGEVNEFTARIPAALAALALVLLMSRWAAKWYGRNVGIAAAVVQLTSVWAIIFARKAEIDMLLCLMTSAAIFLIADQSETEYGKSASRRWLFISLLLAGSWMAKFVYGPLMVLAPAVLFWCCERRWHNLRQAIHPLGWLIMAAAILIWPLLVMQQVPNAFDVWQKETLGRAVGELGHRPVWFYIPQLLWIALPWTPFALAMLPQSWRQAWRNADSRERFLWIWSVSHVVILTLSANKHKHYLFAMMPAMTLWAARGLTAFVENFQTGRWLFPKRLAVTAILVTVAGCAAAPFFAANRKPEFLTPTGVLAVIVGVTSSWGYWQLARDRVTRALTATGINFLAGYIVFNGFILPVHDPRAPLVRTAHEIRTEHPGATVCLFRMKLTGLAYYLDDPVFRSESLEDLLATVPAGETVHVFGYADFVDDLAAHGDFRQLRYIPKSGGHEFPESIDVMLAEFTPRPKVR